MAIEGELTRNYNYSTLKQKLTALLAAQTTSEHNKKQGRKNKKHKEED